MIKVITIDGYSWEKHRINNDKDPNLYWYESPILEKFINEGWIIKDWKFVTSSNGSNWTFILEKEDEKTSSHLTTYKGFRWDE